ncbi:hypothetical protein ACTL6P_19830 [Endozoicomonas acroporae]|uniref:hypothetical protein n=1 Tax=Endozoicomonas acroporae TaxID=1701104 RepID=UPI000C75E07A|nr:hypothetical protein [Endozoicomonas acroporae]
MDTAEREKHARNLATQLRLDYQDSFSQVVTIATQGGDMDDITTRLTNHFLEKTNQAFKVDDDALLLKYTSSPVETEIEEAFDLSALSTADNRELEEKECELAYTQRKLTNPGLNWEKVTWRCTDQNGHWRLQCLAYRF